MYENPRIECLHTFEASCMCNIYNTRKTREFPLDKRSEPIFLETINCRVAAGRPFCSR